jgi:hypothetical protein
MPPTDKAIDAHNNGDFSEIDLGELRAFAEKDKLGNIEFLKSHCEDTAFGVMQHAGQIWLAHIDCDIASSARYSYEAVKSHMMDGGYLVFDDATVSSCIGATEAVGDLRIRREGLNSKQVYPHFVLQSFRSIAQLDRSRLLDATSCA